MAAGEPAEMIVGPHPRAARVGYTSWPGGRGRFALVSRETCEAVEAGTWSSPADFPGPQQEGKGHGRQP